MKGKWYSITIYGKQVVFSRLNWISGVGLNCYSYHHGHAFLFYVPKLVIYSSSNKNAPMSSYNLKNGWILP